MFANLSFTSIYKTSSIVEIKKMVIVPPTLGLFLAFVWLEVDIFVLLSHSSSFVFTEVSLPFVT